MPVARTISKAGSAESEITAGLVSSAVAIPLSMAFGMFAFVSLGDKYFAYGDGGTFLHGHRRLGLLLLGDRSVRTTPRASPPRSSAASYCIRCWKATSGDGPSRICSRVSAMSAPEDMADLAWSHVQSRGLKCLSYTDLLAWTT